MDGSYPDRGASWAARWLVAGVVVAVGAYSWSATADRGGPQSASHSCAEPAVRDLDLQRGTPGEDVMTFVGWSYGAWLARYAFLFPVWACPPIHMTFERWLCVARRVPPYLVEVGVPEGGAC